MPLKKRNTNETLIPNKKPRRETDRKIKNRYHYRRTKIPIIVQMKKKIS